MLTIETSNALDANPIQGRHRPRRSISQIASAAMLAVSVTANPVMWIGTSG